MSRVQRVLTGAKSNAPVMLLIELVKSLSGARVQRDSGVWWPLILKIAGTTPEKPCTRAPENCFQQKYQYLGGCTRLCTRAHPLHLGTCLCAPR